MDWPNLSSTIDNLTEVFEEFANKIDDFMNHTLQVYLSIMQEFGDKLMNMGDRIGTAFSTLFKHHQRGNDITDEMMLQYWGENLDFEVYSNLV